ncbi:MAG: helix-hairpin-helix domain-containing protein [Acidimicrobiales bacterium]
MTLVIIEHDIPLVMELSDRIVAMADGVVIAAGSPQQVRTDSRVVEAYLGGSLETIERSGTVTSGASTDPDDGRGVLSDVRGLGAVRRAALLATFGSVEAIRRATLDELVRVRGIGPDMARRVQERLG